MTNEEGVWETSNIERGELQDERFYGMKTGAMEQTINRMNKSKPRPWLILLLFIGVNVVVVPVAGSFWVPTGPSSYVQLPGVILFTLLATGNCWVFLSWPSEQWLMKVALLVLSLPSLYFGVDTVLMYVTFGIGR